MGILVLREGAHLGRAIHGVELHHFIDEQGVGHAVGQVVERAELMSHGMAHTQEGIGKGHTGHGGGVGHPLPSHRIVSAVVIGAGQIGEDVFQRLEGQAVGIVGGHHGGVGFQSMGHGINAGGRRQALGHGHHHIGVDNRHLGQQLIVGQRVFHAGGLVGDDREGSHLGAGAGGGRHRDEVGLFTHLREGVHALADIHEAHSHIHEIHVRMLVHHPHDLAGVHGGAAAHRDDAVRLERGHGLGAFLRAGQGGIGRHVIEGGMGDTHLVELIGDGLGIAVLVEEGVGHDEGPLFAHDGLQLCQSHRQATFLEIDLFRRAEPQHVLSPLGDGLDVDQVLDAHVLGHGVAAPGAAAQGEGRRHAEVIQIADATVGGGGVDQDAAGFHPGRKGVDLVLFGHGVDVQGRGVAVAAVRHQLIRLVHRVGEILGPVHSQHGGQLFVGEFFLDIHALHLADEDLGGFGHVHAGELGDGIGGLADDFCVERAVDEDGLAHLLDFVGLQQITAPCLEFLAHLVIDLVENDDRLLGGADHAVVEGLGMDNGVDGQGNVRRVVDNGRGVACADAQGGFAGGIRRLDHAGTAGGQNDVRAAHDLVGQLQGGHIDPSDDALRRAGRHGGVQHHLSGGDGALLGAGMGADDDAVASLQANQGFENRGGGGVGGGNDRRHHADGLGNLLDAGHGIHF